LADTDSGKPVLIGGNVCGELVAVFENTDDVVAALRARMQYIGASFGLVEQLAGMAEGALGKYISPLQTSN
jgi:hypothetical protein